MAPVRVALAALVLATAPEAGAVVVAGANGGGNTTNNTTAEQMEAQLGLVDADFYNNVLPYSDATAVYLGWAQTDAGPRAYLLSAMHITLSSTMLINSVSYNVTRESIAGSDLALLTLSNIDGIMPPLPVLNLADTTPTIGTDVIMAGFGRQRVQDATTDADVPDAIALDNGTGYTTTAPQVMRWGTNQTIAAISTNPTATVDIGGLPTVAFRTQFDEPDAGEWLASNEAQAVVGDSGGAVFGHDGILYGITVAVSGTNPNWAVFGERTWFAEHRVLQG